MKKICDYLVNLVKKTHLYTGFTMMEILISLGIIGAMLLILIPAIQSAKPDENEALHKKATFVVERVINELSSDDYLYPNNGEYSSLSNTDNVTYNGKNHGGATKFCTLFASRINKKPGTDVNCTAGAVSVTSVEGISWYLPISDFRNGAETLLVDVNGSEGPNEIGEDQFEYQVQPGFKVPTIEVTHYDTETARPAAKPSVGDVEKPESEKKAALTKHTIACGNASHATILGQGSDKVNGTYTLVAIPEKGYKCNWFTRQVTVKDDDVRDCALTCSPDNVKPVSDGDPVAPPTGDDDDDDDDDDEKEPVEVTVTWSGESANCYYVCDSSHKNCLYQEGEMYKVTIHSNNEEYTAVWINGSEGSGFVSGEGTIVEAAECKPVPKDPCYSITPTVGNPNHCPFTLPTPNCPNEGEEYETLYAEGTHLIKVTPEEGYMFNNSADPSEYQVNVKGGHATPNFADLCKQIPVEKEIIVTPHKDKTTGKLYVTPSEVVPFPIKVTMQYGADYGTVGGDHEFTISSNKEKSNEITDNKFKSAECFTSEDWKIIDPESLQYVQDATTYTIKLADYDKSQPPCPDSNCEINLIGTGYGTESGKAGYGTVQAKVKLNDGNEKVIDKSNSYKTSWTGMKCGAEYTVTVSASSTEDANITVPATATPTKVSTRANPLEKPIPTVTVNFGQPNNNCTITVASTGAKDNMFADISLTGYKNESVKLDKANNWQHIFSGLVCNQEYQVSVAKAGDSKDSTKKITATASPNTKFKLTNKNQDVLITFKDETPKCINVNWRVNNKLNPVTPSGTNTDKIHSITLLFDANSGDPVTISTGGGFGPGESRTGKLCIAKEKFPLVYNSIKDHSLPYTITASVNPNPVSATDGISVTADIKNATTPQTEYTLTIKFLESGTNKTLAQAQTYKVKGGTVKTVTAPDIDGYTLTTPNPQRISMPNKDYTFTFYYEKEEKCELTIASTTGGTTTPVAGKYSITCNTPYSVKATASSGYKFEKWTVGAGGKLGSATNANTTVTLTKDATLTPFFKKDADACKVTMNKIINGVASSTPARGETVEVQCGTPMAVIVTMNTPAEDAVSKYEFKSWQVLKGEGTFANSSNRNTTFTPTTDSTISISTENVQGAIVYLKVTNAGGSQFDNATVFLGVGGMPSDPDSIFGGYVAVGETRIVNVPLKYEQYVIKEGNTCLPDGTCGLYSQNPGGLEYHSEKQYTYEAIIGYGHIEYDCEVEVTATTGGTVQPAGTLGTSCNAPFNIEAIANSGYQFTGWTRVSGNGNFDDSKAALTSYMPFAGKSVIRANFEKEAATYTVRVSAREGGTVSPTQGTVNKGGSLQISATPKSGYVFKKWDIRDGSGTFRGGAETAHTEFYPTADSDIEASFERPVALKENTLSMTSAEFSGGSINGLQITIQSTYPLASPIKINYDAQGTAEGHEPPCYSGQCQERPKTCSFDSYTPGTYATATLNAGESSWTFYVTLCHPGQGGIRDAWGQTRFGFTEFSDSKYQYKHGTMSRSF